MFANLMPYWTASVSHVKKISSCLFSLSTAALQEKPLAVFWMRVAEKTTSRKVMKEKDQIIKLHEVRYKHKSKYNPDASETDIVKKNLRWQASFHWKRPIGKHSCRTKG
ncbi:hypothetical protein CEXT_76201 [Caerostris extrusa]|uniref:Uncharacterized protein n=1 Tax=Caerostris extrusa TaxID=172846 RepID=A0AAV4PBI7_CAEEX|nr:hypothetical protein CEXT_76201 [Caerostris extrusa]